MTMVQSVFERRESEVRAYCRNWPVVFDTGQGSYVTDDTGRRYLDFFTGVATMAYGHNPPVVKEALLEYLARDGLVHALDTHTVAKRAFMEAFEDAVLAPRDLDHRMMFTGPTGTNATEAAIKLARTVTGRHNIVCFTHSFHGLTLGVLPFTSNPLKRAAAGVPLSGATTLPYDGFLDDPDVGLEMLEAVLADPGSGVDKPAAVIVESIQGEGGLNAARPEWLRRLSRICEENGILLILDDVMMGCGRTGDFFSFEESGIVPDVVCLSKALSGYGLPLAVNLVRPAIDVWQPGAHSATFRGHNAAFVTATASIDAFWRDHDLQQRIHLLSNRLRSRLEAMASLVPGCAPIVKGRGLALGLHLQPDGLAGAVCREAFTRGLVVEACGPTKQVIMLLPTLTSTDGELEEGADIIEDALTACVERL